MKKVTSLKSKLKSLPFLNEISLFAKKKNVEIFIVGGFVRDLILKRNRDEIDFLILGDGTAFAKKLCKHLNASSLSIFKNFGTAHFVYENYSLEFVGARSESYDRNSRKPAVQPATFEEDISRRDFTINAMALSINHDSFGKVIDIYNGYTDLTAALIKTPLDPLQTFDDDPLRIMRAFRFAAQLNFIVDDAILDAAEKMRERLKIVSQERITDEFLKILSSPKPSIGLQLLQKTKVMEIIFPEFYTLAGIEQRKDYHHKDVFEHTCLVVDNISEKTDKLWLRFAALIHDIAKPQTKRFVDGIGWTFHGHEDLGAKMSENIFKKLKLPLKHLKYVENLVRLHLRPIALAKEEVTDSAIRRLIVEAGEDLHDLITLCRSDITSKNPNKVTRYLLNYEKVMQRVLEVEEKDRLRAFQSPVRGEEIMSIMNLKPSRKVGEIKTKIENAILEGEIPNTYEAALEYLMQIKSGEITL